MAATAGGARLRAVLLGATALLLLFDLGERDLWAPDEGRYTQVAEELRSFAHGAAGLVVLHLNGEAYTQKPPLYYWLAALFGIPAGHVSELAARLPSALAGVATVALVLRLGSVLFGPASSLCGAALLLTAFRFVWLGRRVQLDVLLTSLETVALLAFWRLDSGAGSRRRNLALLHGAMGLAVLTKGPVGFLLPALAIAGFLAWEHRLRDLRRIFPVGFLALSLGPGLAWILAATALAPEGFFEGAVSENLIGRFFAGASHARPFYYYAYQFPLDFLPWTPLLALAFYSARRRVFGADGLPERARPWRLLGTWGGVFFVFFSLSAGKRGLYLLPAFPAAALLCGDAVVLWLRGRTLAPRALGWSAVLSASLPISLGAVMLAAPGGDLLGAVPAPARAIPAAFGAALLAAPLLGAGAWLALRRWRAPALCFFGVIVGVVFAIELCVFTLVLPAFDAEKSPRPIARAAAALTPEGTPIGLFEQRALVGGLAYYGDRRIAALRSPESVERFVAAGGAAIVVKAKHLESLLEIVPVRVRAALRAGRREVLVVSPARR